MLSTLKDAETGQRGFLLTGNKSYLEKYNAAFRRVPRELEFVLDMCRSDFHGKQLQIRTQLQAVRRYVHTDVSRLQQVIWNILTNASKFTEGGGTISIHTSNDARGNINLTVVDTGIGRTPETIARLFMPFEQGERQLSRRHGRLGLGMAISRALVEKIHTLRPMPALALSGFGMRRILCGARKRASMPTSQNR